MRCADGRRDPGPSGNQRHHLRPAVPGSTPDRALRLILDEHDLVLTDWIIEELNAVVMRKRPDLLPALEDLLASIDPEIAPAGTSSMSIADPDDQPILDAALSAGVDVVISGDKHFLSLALDRPRIVTARAFLDAHADRQAE